MFRYYLKLGLFSIRKNPILSSLMVAAIAVGIGACMTIINVDYVMSGNPIPHRSDILYHVQVDSWSPNDPYEDPDSAAGTGDLPGWPMRCGARARQGDRYSVTRRVG